MGKVDAPSPLQLGWSDLLSGKGGLRALALTGGVALHAVNVYLVITILPSVVRDIGGRDYYAWNTTLFAAASITGSVLAERLFARVGARHAYAIAALIFASGAIVGALASSMPVLLIGRSIQGLGGGLLFALAYTMIRQVYPEPLWPRAMALVSSMWGVATLLGPAIGGAFAQIDSWRAAFWTMVIAACAFGLLASVVLPRTQGEAQPKRTIPWIQLFLIVASILTMSTASVSKDTNFTFILVALSFFCMAVIIIFEQRVASRFLPESLFTGNRTLQLLFLLIAVLNLIVTAAEIFVPLFLQELHQKTPLAAGFFAAAMAAGWALGALVVAGFDDRMARFAIAVSPALAAVAFGLLTYDVPTASGGDFLAMLPIAAWLSLAGFAVGLAWPHLLSNVLRHSPATEQNVASAAITTVQLFSTAMSAAVAGLIVNAAGVSQAELSDISKSAYALLLFCTASAGAGVALSIALFRKLQVSAEVNVV